MREFKPELVPRPKAGPGLPLDQLTRPWELDIGCGTGDFALFRARKTKNPVIAIEKTRSRFLKFKKKCEKGCPENLWPVHANAVWWLAHYGKKNTFENIFLLYPNPYPKKKQIHMRWINRPFMPFLLDLLKKRGKLELRTNCRDYYEEFKEKIKAFSCMQRTKDKVLSSASRPQSPFEKKYLERGQLCYVLVFQKS